MKRLLVVGFGDIARRALPQLQRRYRISIVSRREGQDLDRPESLCIEPSDAVLHLAPPPSQGDADPRTGTLLAAIAKGRILPARIVYVSTSGVYGDCEGARIDETQVLAPRSARARRRVDAENRLALWCSEHGTALILLRAPGIYAADRLPVERLRSGTPALLPEDDVYTNHIHADDLAAATVRALDDDAPPGIYNANDDSEITMGTWLDLVADHAGLPRPPRLSRERLAAAVSPQRYFFMRESRRLDNRRLKQVLGLRLRYPTVHEGLKHGHTAGAD